VTEHTFSRAAGSILALRGFNLLLEQFASQSALDQVPRGLIATFTPRPAGWRSFANGLANHFEHGH
jgi:hypothetical protein